MRVPDVKQSSSSPHIVVNGGPCTNDGKEIFAGQSHGSEPFGTHPFNAQF